MKQNYNFIFEEKDINKIIGKIELKDKYCSQCGGLLKFKGIEEGGIRRGRELIFDNFDKKTGKPIIKNKILFYQCSNIGFFQNNRYHDRRSIEIDYRNKKIIYNEVEGETVD